MAFANSVRDSAVAQINITPLVDVMLVLLVIFMVSAPMVARPLQANLPTTAPPTDRIKPPQLQLEIGDDGGYRLDGRPVTQQQLGASLQQAVIGNADAVLSVRASSDADYQRVVTALAEARNSGVVHIGMQP